MAQHQRSGNRRKSTHPPSTEGATVGSQPAGVGFGNGVAAGPISNQALQRWLAAGAVPAAVLRRLSVHLGNQQIQRLATIPVQRNGQGAALAPGTGEPAIDAAARERFENLLANEGIPARVEARALGDAANNVHNAAFMTNVLAEVRRATPPGAPLATVADLAGVQAALAGPNVLANRSWRDVYHHLPQFCQGIGLNQQTEQFLVMEYLKRTLTAASRAVAQQAGHADLGRFAPPDAEVSAEDLARNFLASRHGVQIAAAQAPAPGQMAAWSNLLRQLPTVAHLLDPTRVPPPLAQDAAGNPLVQNRVAAWRGGPAINLTTNLQYSAGRDRPTGPVPPGDSVYRRVQEADRLLRIMVEPAVLAQVAPPTIFVRNTGLKQFGATYAGFFRAYQDAHSIHIAEGEAVDQIVHEVGHYLEQELPSETWHDIQLLLRHRHDLHRQATGKTRLGHGSLFMASEGRFRGAYPATGRYTSTVYAAGANEVLSRSVESLARPDTARQLIDRDPQQAALILRRLLPGEYANQPALRYYDHFLPN